MTTASRKGSASTRRRASWIGRRPIDAAQPEEDGQRQRRDIERNAGEKRAPRVRRFVGRQVQHPLEQRRQQDRQQHRQDDAAGQHAHATLRDHLAERGHASASARRRSCRVSSGPLAGRMMRKVEPQPRLRLGVDLTAVRLDEALADGETEAGAARALLERAELHELGEELGQLIFGDAGPGVLDGDDDILAAATGGDLDRALLGELDGVGDDVGDDLAQAALVGARVRRGRLDVDLDLDALLLHERALRLGHVADELADVDVAELERDLAGGDGRNVDDLVDEVDEVRGRGEDDAYVLFLLVGEDLGAGIEQRAGAAEDAVERVAQLARDQRQEVGARLIGGLRFFERGLVLLQTRLQARAQFAEGGGEIADLVVGERHHRAVEAARAAAQLVERGGDAQKIARGAAADEAADAERRERDQEARQREAEHDAGRDGHRRHRAGDDGAVDEPAHGAGQRALLRLTGCAGGAADVGARHADFGAGGDAEADATDDAAGVIERHQIAAGRRQRGGDGVDLVGDEGALGDDGDEVARFVDRLALGVGVELAEDVARRERPRGGGEQACRTGHERAQRHRAAGGLVAATPPDAPGAEQHDDERDADGGPAGSQRQRHGGGGAERSQQRQPGRQRRRRAGERDHAAQPHRATRAERGGAASGAPRDEPDDERAGQLDRQERGRVRRRQRHQPRADHRPRERKRGRAGSGDPAQPRPFARRRHPGDATSYPAARNGSSAPIC